MLQDRANSSTPLSINEFLPIVRPVLVERRKQRRGASSPRREEGWAKKLYEVATANTRR